MSKKNVDYIVAQEKEVQGRQYIERYWGNNMKGLGCHAEKFQLKSKYGRATKSL